MGEAMRIPDVDRMAEGKRDDLSRQGRILMAKRYAKRKDILGWGAMLFPDKFFRAFCELHQYQVAHRHDAFTNLEAPRDHAKTTIECFLIPIFQALEEPDTFLHYLNLQSTHEKALSTNRNIRAEFERNDLLKTMYGDMIGERWTDQQFVLKNGICFTAIGAGQSIRGINWRNRRPDYIIGDDLYDDTDIHNPESTRKKNEWFWGAVYPCRAQRKHSAIHIQGTAINELDLMAELKKVKGVLSKTFQRVTDWTKQTVLWPEKNTFAEVMIDKDRMPETIFFREHQNIRRDDALSIVKPSWLEGWEYDPNDLYKRIGQGGDLILQAVIMPVDPSIGKNKESDYTGAGIVLQTKPRDGDGAEYWIEAMWNEHWSLNERVLNLDKIGKAQPKNLQVSDARVEAVAGFIDFADELARRTNLPVSKIDALTDKIANLENKSHFFQNKKVHVSRRIDPKLIDTFKYQLTTNYPNHDDLRDMILLAMDPDTGYWSWV